MTPTAYLLTGFLAGFTTATLIVVYLALNPDQWWPRR